MAEPCASQSDMASWEPTQDFVYHAGGRRPHSVRTETFCPLHQPMYHRQPRTSASASSSQAGDMARSSSSPALPTGMDYGKAIRTLWELQGIDFRKPQESPSAIAPSLGGFDLSNRALAPLSAPKARPKTHDSRCDEVLGMLVSHSGQWGKVQEKQARISDHNRDLMRRNQELQRETARKVQASNSSLMKTFGVSQEGWKRSSQRGCFASIVEYPMQSAADRFFGVGDAHRQAKLRAMAKPILGHEISSTDVTM